MTTKFVCHNNGNGTWTLITHLTQGQVNQHLVQHQGDYVPPTKSCEATPTTTVPDTTVVVSPPSSSTETTVPTPTSTSATVPTVGVSVPPASSGGSGSGSLPATGIELLLVPIALATVYVGQRLRRIAR